MADTDGDDVRCRWSESSRGECSGVCRAFTGSTLVGVCTLLSEKFSAYYIRHLEGVDLMSVIQCIFKAEWMLDSCQHLASLHDILNLRADI